MKDVEASDFSSEAFFKKQICHRCVLGILTCPILEIGTSSSIYSGEKMTWDW